MNRIYRLVWSESRRAFVPVSELSPARKRRKAHGAVARLARASLMGGLCLGALGYHAASHAQSVDDRKLDDLQSLVAKYEHPVAATVAAAVPAPADAASPALAAASAHAAMTPRPAVSARASVAGVKARASARVITVPTSAPAVHLDFDAGRSGTQPLLSQAGGVDLAAGQGRAAAVVSVGNEVADRQRPVALAAQLHTGSALQEGHANGLQLGADGLVHLAAPGASSPAVDAAAHAQVGIGGDHLADVHLHATASLPPVLNGLDADVRVRLGAGGLGGVASGLPDTVDGVNHTLDSVVGAVTANTPVGGTAAHVLQPVEETLHNVATTVAGTANGAGLGGVLGGVLGNGNGQGNGGIAGGLPATVDGVNHTLNSVVGAVTANTPVGGTAAHVLQPVEDTLHNVATAVAGTANGAGLGGVLGGVLGNGNGQGNGGVVLSGLTGTVDGVSHAADRVVSAVTANTPLNGVASAVLPPVEGTLHNVVATVEQTANGSGLGGVLGSGGNGTGLGHVLGGVLGGGNGGGGTNPGGLLGGVLGGAGNGNVVSNLPATVDGVTGAVRGVVAGVTANTPLGGTAAAVLQPVASSLHNVATTIAGTTQGAGLGNVLGGVLGGGAGGSNGGLGGVLGNGGLLGGVLGSSGSSNVASTLPATVDGVVGAVNGVVGTVTAGTPLAGTTASLLQPVQGTLHDVVAGVAGGASGTGLGGVLGGVLGTGSSGAGGANGGLGGVLGGAGTGKLATDVSHTVNDTVAAVGDVLKTAGSGGVGGLLNVGSKLTPVTGDVTTTVNDLVGTATQTLGSTLGSGGNGSGLLGSVPVLSNLMTTLSSPATSATPQAVPVVPPPSATPTGLIVGNGGVIGTANTLLGTTENALFNNTNGYVTNGGLQVNSANFTQGYATVNALGLPLVNLTPAGSLLTTTGGTTLGGTGINSHLTLIGAVKSDSYITNINNGAAGGIAGLLLPSSAPAWASTCLNVLGVVQEQCWAVNAAQDYQVLMGDGASANGSKEVVIGTNASHTLAAQTAASAFPGAGANDPNNPTGVPTADYAARLGHSVVIGDDASGTANAQTIIGAEATASAANSVALGYQSAASRGAQADYSAYGLTAPQTSAGEVSVGSAGKERQITNVAAGSAPTDAVNVAQLQGVAITAGNAVQYDDATRATVTLAGTASTDGGATNGTRLANLHQGAIGATSTDAINGAQLWHWTQDTTNVYSNYSLYNAIKNISPINNPGGAVKYFAVNSTLADAAASGSNGVAVGPVASASGANAVAVGNGATASADNSVAIGSGSVADRANTVSVGSAGNARQITNLAAGTAATDAVNLGQMQASINTSQQGTVRYDSNTDGSVNYGSVTLGNGSGATTIHNVASGVATTDAANVGQLNAGMQQATNWANAYTDQRVGQLSSQIQSVGHRADAGVAAGMAMAGLPQAYEPGRSMAAVSAGSFRGESSIAIGISTISQGGRWVYKLSGSADTRGDAGVAIGAGMQW